MSPTAGPVTVTMTQMLATEGTARSLLSGTPYAGEIVVAGAKANGTTQAPLHGEEI